MGPPLPLSFKAVVLQRGILTLSEDLLYPLRWRVAVLFQAEASLEKTQFTGVALETSPLLGRIGYCRKIVLGLSHIKLVKGV